MIGALEPITDPYQQPKEQQEIVDHVRSKVQQIRNTANRTATEQIWMTNIAYVSGFDNVGWNTSLGQYLPNNPNGGGNYGKNRQIKVNKILATIQNRLARLLKNPPQYDVKPESQTVEDKDAARLAIDILNDLWDKQQINTKRIPLMMWVQECGHAYVKVTWDDQLGKEMVDPMTGELSYEGDVRIDVVSPFEVFPNPMAKTFEDVLDSWVIQCKVRPLDYFKTHYPDRGEAVKEESVWLMSLQYENKANSVNTRLYGQSEGEKNCAIEMIKYEARSKKYPQGRMIVCANGVLLEDKPLPCGWIPFAKLDDIVVAGKYYSEAIVTHLRPIQDQFNETLRKRADWTKRLLAGKYHAFRGAGIQQEAMNDQSGEIVYTTLLPNAPNGGAPTQMQVPMIPQWAYTETDALEKYFNDISGISEVSQGSLPSASVPAIGMQLLVEQDMTRIGVMTEQHERAWARVGTLILKNVEEYYQMPRKLKIAGPNRSFMIRQITGEDLHGNTDVYVIRGSTLPDSKALKRTDIMNAYQQGLLGDPQDPRVREKVLGLIEFGDVQGMWEDFTLDMNQIKRGMEKLEQGEMIEVSELDNHALWVQELNRFRKSDKWDQTDPAVQQLFLDTLEEHVKAQMELTNAVPPPAPPMPEAVAQSAGLPAPGGELPPGEGPPPPEQQ